MNEKNSLIFIRMIEAVETFIPVKAMHLRDDIYLIIENIDMDLDEDSTSIYEFYPGDIVETKIKTDYILPIQKEKVTFRVAYKLIDSSVRNRKVYQLIFSLVEKFGEINPTEMDHFSNEIEVLCSDNSIFQRNHPVVRQWLNNHCT